MKKMHIFLVDRDIQRVLEVGDSMLVMRNNLPCKCDWQVLEVRPASEMICLVFWMKATVHGFAAVLHGHKITAR